MDSLKLILVIAAGIFFGLWLWDRYKNSQIAELENRQKAKGPVGFSNTEVPQVA